MHGCRTLIKDNDVHETEDLPHRQENGIVSIMAKSIEQYRSDFQDVLRHVSRKEVYCHSATESCQLCAEDSTLAGDKIVAKAATNATSYCSICLQSYTIPKILPYCFHVFCQACLETWSKKEQSFRCPSCLKLTEVPADGVSSFQTYSRITDKLTAAFIELDTYHKRQFSTKADLEGASPLFNTPVYCSKNPDVPGPSREVLCQFLTKSKLIFRKNKDSSRVVSLQDLVSMLRTFVGDKPSSAWISDTLPLDLNLPMTESALDCTLVQAFVIGKGLPPILLSVYDETDDKIQRVHRFTANMSKQLTSSLLDFCHCYFDIVPCSLAYYDLSAEKVWAEVNKKQELSRPYCGRDNILTGRSYAKMRAAAVAVTGVSYVPCFLEDPPAKEASLLLLDTDWRRALYLFVEKLADDDQCHVVYTQKSEFKVKVTIMEAAKRQSFVKKVTVFTPEDDTMTQMFERLKAQIDKDVAVQLRLSVQELDCTLDKNELQKSTMSSDCFAADQSLAAGRARKARNCIAGPPEDDFSLVRGHFPFFKPSSPTTATIAAASVITTTR